MPKQSMEELKSKGLREAIEDITATLANLRESGRAQTPGVALLGAQIAILICAEPHNVSIAQVIAAAQKIYGELKATGRLRPMTYPWRTPFDRSSN